MKHLKDFFLSISGQSLPPILNGQAIREALELSEIVHTAGGIAYSLCHMLIFFFAVVITDSSIDSKDA